MAAMQAHSHGEPPVQAQAPQQAPQMTTAAIQQLLEENDALIGTIVENMNGGQLQDCTQYQARLQANLMYLAQIADAFPSQQQQPPPG